MENKLFAGIAKRVITAHVKFCSEVRDELYVRTLAVENPQKLIVILSLDAVGIGWICDIANDFLANLRKMLQERFDIAPEHVIVSATHTHPAAAAQHLPPDELLEVCCDSVKEALAKRTAVYIASGKGEEKRFTLNRTMTLSDNTHWSIRHSNPCPPDELMAKLGPVDHSIGIVRFDRVEDNKTMAVLFNFACHPLWADAPNRISANYPGAACRTIEECLPGAAAIFLQGTAGDIIDRGFKNFEQDRSMYVENFGCMLGLSTVRALNTLQRDTNSTCLDFAETKVRLPRKHDFAERIAELDAEADSLLHKLRGCPLNLRSFMDLYLKYQLHRENALDYPYNYMADVQSGGSLREMDKVNHAVMQRYMENVEIMERLARIEDRRETFRFHCDLNGELADVRADISAIRLGDAVLVTSPTEMLTQVGMDVKNASPFENTFIAAYCNGYLHYGAPAEYYPFNGYEVTECMLDGKWRDIHVNATMELLRQLAGK